MSHHGCPERLSNRSKAFQEEGPSQPTMEVLVETLTGTAFEMTVSPSDTIFAIKSKIFRVEGIPVSQQHLVYNLQELEDGLSLRELGISSGARLRLVLGMRGGPISTRRLPPPAPPVAEPWPDIERLLDSSREEGCKVTVLVFRDGERVNMLRVAENRDGTYSPLDAPRYSSSLPQLCEGGGGGAGGSSAGGGAGALAENAVTHGKMLELRRRMLRLSLRRAPTPGDKVEIQKTRSEETLSVPSLLDEPDPFQRNFTQYSEAEDTFGQLYDRSYTRYDYDCTFAERYTLLPPIGTRSESDQSVQEAGADELKLPDSLAGSILVKNRRDTDEAAILEECLDSEDCLRQDSPPLAAKNLTPIPAAEYGPLVGGGGGGGGGGCVCRSSLQLGAAALYSASTSHLDALSRNSSRLLPALSRHRNREHLHLSDERLHAPRRAPAAAPAPPPAPPAPPPAGDAGAQKPEVKEKKIRIRCGVCRKRLSVSTEHRCRCGAPFCAPHRYKEVHGCRYDYKGVLHQANPLVSAPKLPKI